MKEWSVTRSDKDYDGDITGLCNPGAGWHHRKATVVFNIRFLEHRYIVSVAGYPRALVHVKTGPSGEPYLTTNPDGLKPNNLDELDDC